jgi:hypothetical protein
MGTNAEQGAGTAPPKKKRRWKLILSMVLLVPVLVFALYTWAALAFSYSKGERAGYLQKFSQKGWICKTWEGEIAMANLPGTMPQIFPFSVRNDSIAGILNGMSGQRVNVTYEQHKGVPTSCFGETEYYAIGAQKLAAP